MLQRLGQGDGPVAKLVRMGLDTTDNTMAQMARSFVAGGAAFVVDFSALFVFTHYVGLHYLMSAAIGFLLGLVTMYSLSVRWVFSHRSVQDWRKELIIFTAIGLAGLGLNELIIWLSTEKLGTHYLVSKMISTAVGFFFNFGLRKVLLFSRKK
jgi:putative flippase GtrA